MIQFNELRITPNNSHLIIDVAIRDDEFFDAVSLGSIEIFTLKEDGNSVASIPLKKYEFNPTDVTVYMDDKIVENLDSTVYIDSTFRYVRLVLSSVDLKDTSFSKEIYKVVVKTTGTPSPEMPANYASDTMTALVVNLYPFYIDVLSNMRILNCNCTNTKELVDSILRFKALELSMKTGNIDMAVQYWFKYFSNEGNINGRKFITNNYNCHG